MVGSATLQIGNHVAAAVCCHEVLWGFVEPQCRSLAPSGVRWEDCSSSERGMTEQQQTDIGLKSEF